MKMHLYFIFVLSLILVTQSGQAQHDFNEHYSLLWKTYQDEPSDSGRINALVELINDLNKEPQSSHTNNKQLSAKWQANYLLAELFLDSENLQDALIPAERAYQISLDCKDSLIIIKSNLLMGRIDERSSKRMEAFRHYHHALQIAESMVNDSLRKECYRELAHFYSSMKIYEKAIFYNTKHRDLIMSRQPIDSLALMHARVDLEEIGFFANKNNVNTLNLDSIIEFAIRHNHDVLRTTCFALYRSHLFEAADHAKIKDLYVYRYPADFMLLQKNNPITYFRIKAIIAELENNLDSASYYYKKAEAHIKLNPNKIYVSNFYKRFGEYLLRTGDKTAAVRAFEKSRKLAIESSYYQYISESSFYLDSLYLQQKDYSAAYYSFRDYVDARDYLKSLENTREIYTIEMQYEFDKQMLADSLSNAAERHRIDLEYQQQISNQRLQKLMVLGGIGFLFLIAAGLWSRLRYTRKVNLELETKNQIIEKEKDRSEELLLNILPREVAEELKEHGRAMARNYDEATILFSDFKGFTMISEQMSAPELVAEIDHCFRAFDEITTSHGLEKIKTIGDAYMAAGGLPHPKDTSAKDMVLAAIEMQAFMKQRKKQRDTTGLPAFEMRIGIHSGPVVAGVVGSRKFQYDIWGDTVNTAARMESTGATGRINISHSTYRLIRNESEFIFEYRGKIMAKNKGEMEMYFVAQR